MKVRIEIFNGLDTIARHHKVTDEQWAKSANIRRPSISELRRLYLDRQLEKSIGRACTVEKIWLLYNGLHHILGGSILKKEMMEIVANEKDQDKRMMMLQLILKNAPKDIKDLIESSMMMAIKSLNGDKGK